MIREPFDDLLVRRVNDPAFRILDEGETAQWLRPQVIERARHLFDGSPDVRVEKKKQQLFVNCRGRVAITPKKLKPRWRSAGLTFSSYNTSQNKDYWEQRRNNGFPDLPRLIVGYQFVKEMTDIRIWVAYPSGKWLRNCFLMPDQTGVVLGIFKPAPIEAGEDEDKGYVVKPKKKDLPETGQS
jgi:hypothetical protein